MENKKTPLYDTYEKYGGKIISYGGWLMPIQFKSILKEHEAVRKAAGIFDVSHMGEIRIIGKDALEFVQYIMTNDVQNINNEEVIYSLMCYKHGGIVDDLLLYRFSSNEFVMVINALNIEKDYKWIKENSKEFDVEVINISCNVSEIAIQGPRAEFILQKLTNYDLNNIRFFNFKKNTSIDGEKCLVSRTGYTGEDGFEIYCKPNCAVKVWESIISIGKKFGLEPSGLGARDTLRFEACLPLYGNEISQEITPLESGLGYFVKLNKKNFIGKDALDMQKKQGIKRKLVGLEFSERVIGRHESEIYVNGKIVGFITTGYFSPTLKKSIALGIVSTEYTKIGQEVEVSIRNKFFKARVTNKNFYKKNYKK